MNSDVGEANTEIAGGSIVIHVQKNKSASVFSQINGNNIHPFVNVYPNPTTGKVILDIENFSNPSVKVEVIHLTGQKVLEKIYALPGQIELDISGNTTGLYFIHAEIDGQKCIRKINYIEN